MPLSSELGVLIHQGLSALIYHRAQSEYGRPVAIKVPAADSPSPHQLGCFDNEWELTKDLGIDGARKSLARIRVGDRPALVFEYFSGKTLWQAFVEARASMLELVEVASRTAQILADLHEHQIVHRDINSHNILVDLVEKRVLIIDFGKALRLDLRAQCSEGPDWLDGNLAYISPEQTGRTHRRVDYRTDFYSLGVTLYELIAGQLPFSGKDALTVIHGHLAGTPRPLNQLNPEAPLPLVDIVAKLMAKTPEDRYQSAFGLKADLERCRADLQRSPAGAAASMPRFELGTDDYSSELRIPEKLYGRSEERAALLSAFQRAVSGEPQLVLLSGPAGVGKSALAADIRLPVAEQNGYFVSGKFDQSQAATPHFAILQAIGEYVDCVLAEDPSCLAVWQARVLAAVGDNVAALIEAAPCFRKLLGDFPALERIEGPENHNRLNLTLRVSSQAFDDKDRPMVVFIDDWQWSDPASLDWLKIIMTRDAIYRMTIVAFRENELAPDCPFLQLVGQLESEGLSVRRIQVPNLSLEGVEDLVADTVHWTPDDCRSLAQVIHQVTQGNVFFVRQYLDNMRAEGWLRFEVSSRHWVWDMEAMQVHDAAGDVGELVTNRLLKLPAETARLLSEAALIGDEFRLLDLVTMTGFTLNHAIEHCRIAVNEGFIVPLGGYHHSLERAGETRFRFLHDRVRQAAEAALPAGARQAVHLKFGRALLESTAPTEPNRRVFEVVRHYRNAQDLVTDPVEAVRLAELNLQAADQAFEVAAFESAHSHLRAALAWLPDDAWTHHYSLTLALHSRLARVVAFSGDLSDYERVLATTEKQARSRLDVSQIRYAKVQFLVHRGAFPEAIEAGMALIEEMTETEIPRAPSIGEALACLRDTTVWMTESRIQSLVELPVASSEVDLAQRTAVNINVAVYGSNIPLFLVSVSRAARLCFERGMTTWSPVALMTFGLLLCAVDHEVPKARLLAEHATRLFHERFRVDALVPSMNTANGGFISHRHQHLKHTLPILAEAVAIGLRTGEFHFVGQCAWWRTWHQLFLGAPLDQVEAECWQARQTCRKVQMPRFGEWCLVPHQAVLNLRGSSAAPWELRGQICDDQQLLALAQSIDDFAELFRILFYRGWLRYLFGQFERAVEVLVEAEAYLAHAAGLYFTPLYYLYDSLSNLAMAHAAEPRGTEILERVARNLRELEPWLCHAPMNHQHKVELVLAEQARVKGQYWEATDHYERAIQGARQLEFIHEEALACELYGRFWITLGRQETGHFYLRKARNLYALWGAMAKVAQLEAVFGPLPGRLPSVADSSVVSSSTFGSDAEIAAWLDISTLMKANQALSRSVQLDELLTQMVTILLESAGAERAVVLCRDGERWFVEARGVVGAPTVQSGLHAPLTEEADVPLSLFHYAVHTGAPLLLPEAVRNPQFGTDPYVRRRQLKSVLCLPIHHKEELKLVLYLENNLCVGAFTEGRLELLRLLSGQMAISLENAHFYDHLEALVARRTEELAEARDRAEAASRAKSEFVASVSHEFRSPLSAILGFSDLLLREAEDGTQALSGNQQDDIRQIRRGGEHLLTLINNVLDLSKIESGRAELNLSGCDLHQVLLDLHAMFLLGASEKGVALNVVQEPSLVRRICTDEVKLRQILINLLANAIKFTQRGTVTLRVEHGAMPPKSNDASPPGSHAEDGKNSPVIRLRFSVADTGSGIAAHELGTLFQAFTQTSTGRASRQGTGLGLTICRHFVQLMGGEIWVESTPGQGTVFQFELPVRVLEEQANAHSTPSPGPLLHLEQYRMVVVDDNPINRRLLVGILKPFGCELKEAVNGREAVDLWRIWKPHLIWMDMRMPIMDGYEAAAIIKSEPNGARTKIIAATASSFVEERPKVLEAGCDDLLSKPFSEEQVRALLCKHLPSS